MAIVPQVYTLTSGWTTLQLADTWKQMLIDAGLMSDWHDSVNNGSHYHRILRLTNDANKVYGYQYIRFLFYNYDVFIQFATQWDAVNHIPLGTQYHDYVTPTCANATTGFTLLQDLSSAQTYSFVRYTSGSYTFFSAGNLIIRNGIGTVPSWLDLDKAAVFSVFNINYSASSTGSGWRSAYFSQPYQLRRMLGTGSPFAGTYSNRFITSGYCYNGIHSTSDVNDPSATSEYYAGMIRLPSFHTSVNPAYSANYAPIVTGLDLFPLFDMRLPDDFAMTTTFGLTPVFRDLIHVTPGVESWEVLGSYGANSTNSLVFLARTT